MATDELAAIDVNTAVADAITRRGIDPALLLDPRPVMDPRGSIMDGDEIVAWRTEEVLGALQKVAAGEFELAKLPALHPFTAEWIAEQKKDPSAAPWLVLFGSVGCGKTSQAIGAIHELAMWHARTKPRETYNWQFTTHRNFTAAVRASDEDAETVIRRFERADLLVLDDLGDYNTQDFGRSVDATARLINYRNHHRLPTIYTTNLLYQRDDTVIAMEQQINMRIATLSDTLDGRVVSRLEEGWTAPLPEHDYRATKGRVMGA